MKNIACIGAGYWGKNLVRNFYQLGVLHSVCDNSSETLERCRELYSEGIDYTTSYSGILQNPEIAGVVIATPAVLHYQYAKEALLKGKDVFVEKPLALTVKEGNELVEIAAQHNRILMVGHILEYHPAVLRLKRMIDEGVLGKIYYIYSNRLNLGKIRTEENILWSFAPHDIAVMTYLLNEVPVEISCSGGSYLHEEIADVTMTAMDFASGVKGHIFVSWLHPFKEQKFVVVGDKKMVVFDDTVPKDKLLLYSHNIEWVKRVPVPHREEAEAIPFEHMEPLRAECQHFLDCMANRQTPRTDGKDGVRVLEVLESAQESLGRGGQKVRLYNRDKYSAHETAIIDKPCTIGVDTKIWHFSHIMKNAKIGNNCNIGQNVLVSPDVIIGNNVKIQNNVSVYSGVILEDNVFCGPSMVFTNVVNPRSHVSRKNEYRQTLVREGATLGANCTIVCGVTIGKYAFVGAGAVVTHDVADYGLVYGNPARLMGWVCSCGIKLAFDGDSASCISCGKSYRQDGNFISLGEGKTTS